MLPVLYFFVRELCYHLHYRYCFYHVLKKHDLLIIHPVIFHKPQKIQVAKFRQQVFAVILVII